MCAFPPIDQSKGLYFLFLSSRLSANNAVIPITGSTCNYNHLAENLFQESHVMNVQAQ